MSNKPKSTDVEAVPETRTLVQRTFAEAALSMVQPDSTSDEIVMEILTAETVDEILSSNAVGLQSVIGQPFTIDKAYLRESDFEDGLAAYLVMHVTMDNGEPLIVTTGAQSVVAQVVRMNQLGVLPYRVNSRKPDKPTEAGYYPISLCKAPALVESF